MQTIKDERQGTADAFGQVLRKMRISVRTHPKDLEDRADADRTYPSLLERGLRTPTIAAHSGFTLALDCDPTQFLGMTQEIKLRRLSRHE